MLASHFREHQDSGRIGRVEFLPVRWHSALHGDATGVDRLVVRRCFTVDHNLSDVSFDVMVHG